MTADPDALLADDAYVGLRPAQREHLRQLLAAIHDPQLKLATEAIFWRGLHDIGDLRMLVQSDLRVYRAEVVADLQVELSAVRGDVGRLGEAVGRLDSGLSIAEQLSQLIAERELLPAVQALRDDIARLARVIGEPTKEDPRPLHTRQIDTAARVGRVERWVPVVLMVAVVALVVGVLDLYLWARDVPGIWLGLGG